MVVIKKLSNIIPIDFGEFQLEYTANDKGVKELDKFREDLSKSWKKIEKLSDEKIAERKSLRTAGLVCSVRKPLKKSINSQTKIPLSHLTI